jgi:hypothetical protein
MPLPGDWTTSVVVAAVIAGGMYRPGVMVPLSLSAHDVCVSTDPAEPVMTRITSDVLVRNSIHVPDVQMLILLGALVYLRAGE